MVEIQNAEADVAMRGQPREGEVVAGEVRQAGWGSGGDVVMEQLGVELGIQLVVQLGIYVIVGESMNQTARR